MDDTDLLLQRFVDQELTPEERVRFVARLGRDAALRQRVIDLEQLALDASRLSRLPVSTRFVDRVVARAMPRQPMWRRWLDSVFIPRTLRWNIASAAALVTAVIVGVATLVPRYRATTTTISSTGVPASTTSDATARTILVRLVVVEPGAKTVSVAGDFNGWSPTRTPLEPSSGGAWTVTIPLEPGRYEYMFVVNGQNWIVDPFAFEKTRDGFGSENSVLDVRPAAGVV
jgi:hypothetical protein